ncbi:MAG: glycoside hydrolase family 13 protein [Verrucomicrobiota bacterium]|nr:glycoside hydrolase family 13 protein [Verrucomicrobiota bacterium]
MGKPEWAAEAIFYQIFPERFRNGDPKNDPTRDSLEPPVQAGPDWRISSWTADWYARDEWEKELGPDFYRDGVFERRYGGDLQGVIDKLDYISELGVNAIYFNPLFYARSLHKYDGASYHHIDPYFGPDPNGDLQLIATETMDPKTWKWTAADKLFLDLLKQCHARGLRVIIDGVFNHTGRDFFAFKDLREKQQRSPYKDWYVVTSFDDARTKRNEFDYKGWWGTMTLPVFAATSDKQDMAPGPKAYIFDATRRWMRPNGKMEDGIDGWRLDVADERPAKFWADWNSLVRQLNPNAYTTAEIWKNASELVQKGGFSASMNYNAFTIPVKGFLGDNNVAPSRFAKLLDERRKQFPPQVAAVMQNLMDSHDTDRLASMIVNGEGTVYAKPGEIDFNTNNDARGSKTYQIRKPNDRERSIQRMIALFQMTYVGSPMIYYGTESGMWGGHDPDDRMPMVWADMTYDPQAIDPRGNERTPDEVAFDGQLFDYYKSAIALRRQHEALNHGEYSVLTTDDVQRSFVFTRRTAKETLLIALNRGEQPATVELHLSSSNLRPIFVSQGELGAVTASVTPTGGKLVIPALTGVVLGYN